MSANPIPRLGAALLLAAPAFASTPQEPPHEPITPARYVLHLSGGGVLRAEARAQDGVQWDVRRGKTWQALPAGSVTRAVPERELLARARRLGREAAKGDTWRRTAYADWLIVEGLHAEALQALDGVLEEDPGAPAALELLRKTTLRLGLPDLPAGNPTRAELEPFLRAAARYGPAGRELAALRLAETETTRALLPLLEAELVNPNPKRRAFAAHALGQALTGQRLEPLLARAVLDSSDTVRRSAAGALRAAEEPALCVPIVRALGSRHQRVRANAIDALADMHYPVAIAPLVAHLVALQSGSVGGRVPHMNISITTQTAYVQDFDVEVAQFAAIADPVINVLNHGSVLDVAVLAVNQVVRLERARTRRALTRLTGADPGHTTAAWSAWWQEHEDDWRTRPPTDSSTSSRSPGT